MACGFDKEFDLQSVPDEVIKGIRESIKLWDAALQKRNEEIIRERQEEIKRLEAEHNELMGDKQLHNVPKPKCCKMYFCPCMNDGDGGLVTDENQMV